MKRRKRHRVVMRPKVRVKKIKQQGAIAVVLVLGVLAAVTVRHFQPSLPTKESFSIWNANRTVIELEGAPPDLEGPLREFLSRGGDDFQARAQAVRERYSFFESVTARRSWFKNKATFRFKMHEAVARVGDGAKRLSRTGVLYDAPAGDSGEALVSAELAQAGEAQIQDLARYLSDLPKVNSLPSPLERMCFVSMQEGWKAVFQDGTEVLWGNLNWTDEKMVRLREVLSDSRNQGALVADLRYFEDGKILLRQRPGRGVR